MRWPHDWWRTPFVRIRSVGGRASRKGEFASCTVLMPEWEGICDPHGIVDRRRPDPCSSYARRTCAMRPAPLRQFA
jgi:hypothetical protein